LSNDKCSIEGCTRGVYARNVCADGWCRSHHLSWLKYGDPLVGFQRAFDERIDKSAGADGCWNWVGALLPNGYGYFHSKYPHRLAYEMANGPIPPKMEIDHTCHNRACVNIAHLRLVTPKQNKEHRQGAQRNNACGIRGVRLMKHGRWRAVARHNGKDVYIGMYDTAEKAAEAARQKRMELFTHNDLDRQTA